VRQYQALLETEDVKLSFTEARAQAIAAIAAQLNERGNDIGARRLHTVMERLLDELSFTPPTGAALRCKWMQTSCRTVWRACCGMKISPATFSEPPVQQWIDKARVLVEALPYMRRFQGKILVIKYGGHAMNDAALRESFAVDVVLMKHIGLRPVIVHGGGPQIARELKARGIESRFVNGLRATSDAAMEVVATVLGGELNRAIVERISQALGPGGGAEGLRGDRDGILQVRRRSEALGRVGEVVAVNAAPICAALVRGAHSRGGAAGGRCSRPVPQCQRRRSGRRHCPKARRRKADFADRCGRGARRGAANHLATGRSRSAALNWRRRN